MDRSSNGKGIFINGVVRAVRRVERISLFTPHSQKQESSVYFLQVNCKIFTPHERRSYDCVLLPDDHPRDLLYVLIYRLVVDGGRKRRVLFPVELDLSRASVYCSLPFYNLTSVFRLISHQFYLSCDSLALIVSSLLAERDKRKVV